MNKADAILQKVFDLAKFCPIGGEELVVVEHRWNSDKVDYKKVCPAGHGEMDVGFEYGPEAVFTVSDEFLANAD